MVVLGYEDTLTVTMEEMNHHIATAEYRYAVYVISDIGL